MLLRAGAVFAFDDVRRTRPRRVHIAFLEQKALDQIVGAPDDNVLTLALFNGEDRRQRLILDFDRRHGLAQLVFVRMRQQQDGLVAVVDDSVGKAGLIGKDDVDVILAGNIGGGDDCEFVPVDAGIIADGTNESARDGAANGGSEPHALALHVVHVAGAAQQFVHAFLAGDGCSNDAGFRARAHSLDGLDRVRVEA